MGFVLAMFPGQGSQYVGMGKRILEQFPYTRPLFEEAEDASKLFITKLCTNSPPEELQKTHHQQPCLVTMSMAHLCVLEKETDFRADYYAGHSLGEYSALVGSGLLAFSQAVHLVTHRGKHMQEAVEQGLGGMAAVIKVPEAVLRKACQEASRSHKAGVAEIVNFNSPDQLIISGHKTCLEVVRVLLQQTIGRFIYKELPVSAPFHSSLMQPAKDHMKPLLESLTFKTTPLIIANLTGELARPYTSTFLIDQIDQPVLWYKSLQTALQLEVTHVYEVGPGSVLSGLVQRTFSKEQLSVQASQDLPALRTP